MSAPEAEPAPDLPPGLSRQAMDELPFALVVADARLPDMPMIYVNAAFERATGYSRSAAIGHNCRFLQGPATDEADRRAIREALNAGRELTIDILNYRANGEQFVNRLLLSPLKLDGEVTHYLGIQSEHPKDRAFAERAAKLDEQLREVQHRVKNHLALLLSLIRLESRKATNAQAALAVLANRVEALNVLYDEFSRSGRAEEGTIALGAYISRVCKALDMIDGHRVVRMSLETGEVRAMINAASQVGLLVSELLTNALQHAFGETEDGVVEVRLWQNEESGTICLQVADNGCGIPPEIDWPREGSLGARIVRELTGRLEGDLTVKTGPDGTLVIIALPASAITPGVQAAD